MADLSAMYMDLAANSGRSTDRGFLGMQQMMENQLAYQKAREDIEAQRGLRALFAEKPNATPEEVSRFSPQLGMEMVKAQQEAQERQGRMTKTQREITEMEAKAVAETLGPIAERALVTGDINAYHREIGQAASALAQQGIPLPMNFDPQQHTPDLVLQNSVGRGYKSPLIENQMAAQREQMLSRVPPRMSPGQAYGEVESSPYGYKYKPPLPQAGAAPQAQPTGNIPAPTIEFEGQTYTGPQFAKAFMAETDPARRAKMNEYIDASMASQQQGLPQAQFITPEQERQLRTEEEQQKADIQTKALGERKESELTIEREQSKKKAIEAFALIPTFKEVEDLISGSTSGGKQLQAAKAFEDITGKSTPGMQNIGTLGVIAGRLRDAVNRAPGNQSDKDAIIESLKTGDIANPEVGAQQRVKAYKEFVRQMREMIKRETGMDAGPIDESSASQAPVTVKSRAEVEALPKGTLFMGSDGVLHRRK